MHTGMYSAVWGSRQIGGAYAFIGSPHPSTDLPLPLPLLHHPPVPDRQHPKPFTPPPTCTRSTSIAVSKASYLPLSPMKPPVMLLYTRCKEAHSEKRGEHRLGWVFVGWVGSPKVGLRPPMRGGPYFRPSSTPAVPACVPQPYLHACPSRTCMHAPAVPARVPQPYQHARPSRTSMRAPAIPACVPQPYLHACQLFVVHLV